MIDFDIVIEIILLIMFMWSLTISIMFSDKLQLLPCHAPKQTYTSGGRFSQISQTNKPMQTRVNDEPPTANDREYVEAVVQVVTAEPMSEESRIWDVPGQEWVDEAGNGH